MDLLGQLLNIRTSSTNVVIGTIDTELSYIGCRGRIQGRAQGHMPPTSPQLPLLAAKDRNSNKAVTYPYKTVTYPYRICNHVLAKLEIAAQFYL